jgi:hypothetical protein
MRARSVERAFISLSDCHCEPSQHNVFNDSKIIEKVENIILTFKSDSVLYAAWNDEAETLSGWKTSSLTI